jgi:hypothetical protein
MTDGEYFKIGKSVNPQKRYKQLITGNAKLVLIDYSDKVRESELHKLYRNHRVQNEWFNLTEDHVKDILDMFQNGKTHNFLIRLKQVKTIKRKIDAYDSFMMPFGKYKGMLIRDVDDIEYFRWLKSRLNEEMSINQKKTSLLFSSLRIHIRNLMYEQKEV